MDEVFLCIEDFFMENGEQSFTKGKTYINMHDDDNSYEIKFYDDQDDKHFMGLYLSKVIPEDDYDFFMYFKRIG